MVRKLVKGKVNASKYLKENPKIRDSLVKEIRDSLHTLHNNKSAKKVTITLVANEVEID